MRLPSYASLPFPHIIALATIASPLANPQGARRTPRAVETAASIAVGFHWHRIAAPGAASLAYSGLRFLDTRDSLTQSEVATGCDERDEACVRSSDTSHLSKPTTPRRLRPKVTRQSPADPSDGPATIDALIHDLYGSISGPAGAPRDLRRERALFTADARLVPIVRDTLGARRAVSATVDEYFGYLADYFRVHGFAERELGRSVRRFGQMAVIISAYESRDSSAAGVVITRGINAVLASNDGSRWWIHSLMWDEERPGSPIPIDLAPSCTHLSPTCHSRPTARRRLPRSPKAPDPNPASRAD